MPVKQKNIKICRNKKNIQYYIHLPIYKNYSEIDDYFFLHPLLLLFGQFSILIDRTFVPNNQDPI